MQINSSLSSTSSVFNMDEMDSKLSSSIISAKDTDSSGTLSASELGVSSTQLSEFDTDGDGEVSSEELTAGLKTQREKMQAQMSNEMAQSSQMGMLQTSLSSTSEEAPSLDDIVSNLFGGSSSASSGTESEESTSVTVSASSSSSSQTGSNATSALISSNAGNTLSEYLEEMDAQMAETIMSLKDTNKDGALSAEEMGATAAQISELDTDGDGVLNESELTAGLKAERETMMAENGGVMPPPPTDSTSSSSTSSVGSATDSASIDALMSSMFSSVSSTSSTTDSSDDTTAAFLSEFLLRQKASNAYQSVDNLIAGLFDSGATSQSVSLSA